MTRIPTSAAINAAELRLLQSKRNVRESVERTRSALRTAMARPSTLLLVAAGSGVSAFLVSRWRRPPIKSVPASSPGLVRTLVSMYGAGLLASVFQHGAAAWKQIGSRVSNNRASSAAPGDSKSAERDR